MIHRQATSSVALASVFLRSFVFTFSSSLTLPRVHSLGLRTYSRRVPSSTRRAYTYVTQAFRSLRMAKPARRSQPELGFSSHFVPSCIRKGKRKALPPEGAGLPNCYRACMFAKRLDGRCCGTRDRNKPRMQRERGTGPLPV